MTKMTETEKQARREGLMEYSFHTMTQSIRDWQQMLLVIDIPLRSRVLLLEAVKIRIDQLIEELER